MSPDASEDPTPRESGNNPNTEGNSDYFARGDYGSARFGSDRGSLERREFMNEGERRGSPDMPRMEFQEGGPHGPYGNFFGGKRYGSLERPFDQRRGRSWEYGRMGRADYGSPNRFANARDYDRYGYRKNFPNRNEYGMDYGRSRYGRSMGGYGDDYMRYGRDGSYGRRGYGYGDGSDYGSRMARYGYGGNERGYRGSSSNRGQDGMGVYGRSRDYGYGRSDPHRHGYGDSSYRKGQGYGSYSSFDPARYSRSRFGMEGSRQGSDYRRGYFDSSSYPDRYGYSSDNRYGGSRPGYGQGYGGFRPPFAYSSRDRFGGYGGQHGYGGSPDYRRSQYGYGGYPYGSDRHASRYGSYGRGPNFRGSQYGSHSGYRSGAPPPFPSFSQSKSHHPPSYESQPYCKASHRRNSFVARR